MKETVSDEVWNEVRYRVLCKRVVITEHRRHHNHTKGSRINDSADCIVVNRGNLVLSLFFKHCDGTYKNALGQPIRSVTSPAIDGKDTTREECQLGVVYEVENTTEKMLVARTHYWRFYNWKD